MAPKRRSLRGKGPTPKAEDRTWHKAYRDKSLREKRKAANPYLAAKKRGEARRKEAEEIIIGRNACLEALKTSMEAKRLFLARGMQKDERVEEICSLASKKGIPVFEKERGEIESMARNKAHQGVLLEVKAYEYKDLDSVLEGLSNPFPLFVAADGLTDPQNLGAIIRSAAAFGSEGVIIPHRRNACVNAACWKASAGACAFMNVIRVENLNLALEKLKKLGYAVIGLDGDGEREVGKTGFESDPLVLVAGCEGKGISRLTRTKCDMEAKIPIEEKMESLNVSAATAIALFATVEARRASGLKDRNI
ncbi:MAG: 23S rRNA (guanosine(2251)-2'-O)-methyltransferase RlmB [Aeriscardovia sp.]|nr:23S rRNA (guanosine(2251)-2'-O)-methyltransferase RlmB [Aeriscardovia sp.]